MAQARKPATIREVAELAGVSKSTVANVLRETAPVAELTRSRVLAAIEHLGYRPNALARSFVNQRTTIAGVLVGDLGNPYYGEMARLVERELFGRGYTAMLSNIEGDPAMAPAGIEALLEQRVAGIVFLALFARDAGIAKLLSDGPEVVLIGWRDAWAPSVLADDRGGGRLAAEHLIGLGHRRIAFLTTPAVEPGCEEERRGGYAEALAKAGLTPLPTLRLRPGDGDAPPGERDADLIAALRGAERPTALFVSNDTGAIAVLDVLDAAGLRIPEDVSVVGFDNVGIAGLRRISLTTVAQPLPGLAAVGVDLLLRRIEGGGDAPPPLAVELVERSSTGPPPT